MVLQRVEIQRSVSMMETSIRRYRQLFQSSVYCVRLVISDSDQICEQNDVRGNISCTQHDANVF